MKHETDTLIVGGGLAGLHLAMALETEGQDYLVLETRNRFGGRILSHDFGGAFFDMGPAWFWPGQPRIERLVKEFGLKAFPQFSTGDVMLETEHGQVQRGMGWASMDGAFRLQGGFQTLIDALVARLPAGKLKLEHHVRRITQNAPGIEIEVVHQENVKKLRSKRIVLALPPRLVGGLSFSPPLPDAAQTALRDTPTWMAGHAKAIAVYDSPFWRDAGLSGDAMSRFGPLMEIHDASPADGGPYALFGFVGVSVQSRQDTRALQDAVLAQLSRLFGTEAATPSALHIMDWAFEPATAVPMDHAPLFAHPRYGLPKEVSALWDNTVILGSTEVAPGFGGFLEGALEAAENAAAQIL